MHPHADSLRLLSLLLLTEKSCLLVCRRDKGLDVPASPSLHRHNVSQMVFHKIKKEDLQFVRPCLRAPLHFQNPSSHRSPL